MVAREYAFAEGKRDDWYSPATSMHVLKVLPALYMVLTNREEIESNFAERMVLPGQRKGAQAGFEHLESYLVEEMKFEGCSLLPCLFRHQESGSMIFGPR